MGKNTFDQNLLPHEAEVAFPQSFFRSRSRASESRKKGKFESLFPRQEKNVKRWDLNPLPSPSISTRPGANVNFDDVPHSDWLKLSYNIPCNIQSDCTISVQQNHARLKFDSDFGSWA